MRPTNFRNRENLLRYKGVASRRSDAIVVLRVNEDEPELKTLHPMAGRIEASIRHGQVARTILLSIPASAFFVVATIATDGSD